jgi:hypothetical protein
MEIEKKVLESFIRKYSLNQNIEKAKITCKNKTLKTSTISDEKNCLCIISLDKFGDLEDCEFGVYNTSKLKQLLSVLSDKIDVSLNKVDDKITSLTLADNKIQVQYCTADLSAVKDAPALKQLPDFNCGIVVNEDFVSKFIKAKNALSDVDTFTLIMKKDKLNLVIGYSSINSDRITLDINTVKGKDTVEKPLSFSAKYFKEILSANSESSETVFNVSDKGLGTISFRKDNFESNYYIVATPAAE